MSAKSKPDYAEDAKVQYQLSRMASEYNALLRAARDGMGLSVTTEIILGDQIKVTVKREIWS